jgi:TonB family protein
LDQAIAIPIADVPSPWHMSRRRARRIGPVLLISLWLHLTLLLLLVVTVHYDHREEELPPASTVAMVFEGGKPEGPALPNSQPDVAVPTEPPAPAPEPQVAPSPQVALAPQAPAPQAAPIPAPVPAPPAPSPPPAATAEIPAPRPPPPLAMVIPRPPAPTPPSPALRPAPQPSIAPSRPPAFPTPMNFSFNQPPPQARPPARTTSRAAPNTLDFSLAPRQGATDNTPFSRVAGAHAGPDWRNQLSAWVRSHAYYPRQAAMNDEDGDVTVQVVANPNGHVASVEMKSRSRSQWLDMALMGLFRDADLPPLFGESEPVTFNFTMHYILIRGR